MDYKSLLTLNQAWAAATQGIECLKGMTLAEAMQRWDSFLDNPQGQVESEIDSILSDDLFDISNEDLLSLAKDLDTDPRLWEFRRLRELLLPGINHHIIITHDARLPWHGSQEPTSIRVVDDEPMPRGILYLALLVATHTTFFFTRQLDGDEGGECKLVYLLPTAPDQQQIQDLINNSYGCGPDTPLIEDPNYSLLGYNQMKAIINSPEEFTVIWCGAY